MSYSVEPFEQKIAKPWGHEVVFTPPGLPRTGKLLAVKAGKRLSLQYHDLKEETMCLISGRALIWLENAAGAIEKIEMPFGRGFTVRTWQKHRLEAIEDSLIVEVSDPEKGTTVRLDDDFRRPDETEAVRNSKDRGWLAG